MITNALIAQWCVILSEIDSMAENHLSTLVTTEKLQTYLCSDKSLSQRPLFRQFVFYLNSRVFRLFVECVIEIMLYF